MAVSRALSDYILSPGYTSREATLDKVDLRTPLLRYHSSTGMELPPEENPSAIMLNTPYLSAKMQAVGSPELAIALAQNGGIGVIPSSQDIDVQANKVRETKKRKAGFVTPDVVSPDMSIEDIARMAEERGYSTFPVTEDGTLGGKFVGYITKNDYHRKKHAEMKVSDRMRRVEYERGSSEVFFAWDYEITDNPDSLQKANEILIEGHHGSLPIVRADGTIKYVVFKGDIDKHLNNPHELVDENKRYRVGAAANTHDYEDRVPALVDAGTDVIFFDNSDIHGFFAEDVARYMHDHYHGLPFSLGNFVTEEGGQFAIDLGAYLIAAGIGIGSICTSSEQIDIGSGQATAIQNVAKARNKHFAKTGEYVPITADGGITKEVLESAKNKTEKEEMTELDEGHHISIALSLGADHVMMGRYFARFDESPSPRRTITLRIGDIPFQAMVKEYWGEGSDRAQEWRSQRYTQRLVAEGIDSVVPYAGPMRPTLDVTTEAVKSALMHCGTPTISDLHAAERHELRSRRAKEEGKPHSVTQELVGMLEDD